MRIFRYTLPLLMIVGVSFAQQGNTPSGNRADIYNKMQTMERIAVERELNLKPEQLESFRSIYKEYQEQCTSLSRRKRASLNDRGGEMSDKQVEVEIENILQRNMRSAQLKKTYYTRLREVLTARQVAQIYYIEREIRERLLFEQRQREERNRAQEGRPAVKNKANAEKKTYQ